MLRQSARRIPPDWSFGQECHSSGCRTTHTQWAGGMPWVNPNPKLRRLQTPFDVQETRRLLLIFFAFSSEQTSAICHHYVNPNSTLHWSHRKHCFGSFDLFSSEQTNKHDLRSITDLFDIENIFKSIYGIPQYSKASIESHNIHTHPPTAYCDTIGEITLCTVRGQICTKFFKVGMSDHSGD